jgi:hypothetical protein
LRPSARRTQKVGSVEKIKGTEQATRDRYDGKNDIRPFGSPQTGASEPDCLGLGARIHDLLRSMTRRGRFALRRRRGKFLRVGERATEIDLGHTSIEAAKYAALTPFKSINCSAFHGSSDSCGCIPENAEKHFLLSISFKCGIRHGSNALCLASSSF